MYYNAPKLVSGNVFDNRARDNAAATSRWLRFALRKRLEYPFDLMVLMMAFTLAYLLRFDFVIPSHEKVNWLWQLPYVMLIQLGTLYASGVHRFIWKYVGIPETKVFVRAACFSILPVVALRLTLPDMLAQLRVPLSVMVVDTVLAFGGALGLRVLLRALYEGQKKREKTSRAADRLKSAVLLIGAGRAGMLAAREIQSRGDVHLDIRGFIDDDPKKLGSVIQGVEVVGATRDLARLVSEMGIDHVVITIAHASRREIRQLVSACERVPIKARIVPGLQEILQGKVEVSNIRDVNIEDLLGRETIQLDEQGMKTFLAGKAVMVTGAGGSIGSEMARQVARFCPSALMLVERAEFSLFAIDRELREAWPGLSIIPLIADVGDDNRISSIFASQRPQVVFHAAAHKHVPMMEFNLTEAVKNNVLATHTLGRLAGEAGVEVFVMISTDKAVRPTSVMGASKRVAELVVQYLNQTFATRYVSVRFGNVIGSAGSVVPIFRDQIRKGGPVTVTDPEMVRYFMTIPEASQLVLQAATMGEGGEIFVLDMGEPVRILDLAKDVITLSGLKPFDDIDIVFTGKRPGEKLFEEIEMTSENLTRTRHPKIFIGRIVPYPPQRVEEALRWLSRLTSETQERQLRQYLSQLLPESQLSIGAALGAAFGQRVSTEARPAIARD